ncbi:hypothetical protein E3T55_11815 [Cryobacterium frigoriphilum]|uniref:Camelysin metallo-endopeptidase n=1 Tax=Cryobacterium frigoriphilum TaxID=1259150 RepID=A0A4R8ZYR6_9MICO|nr:TasA family protein [Cryobacterium frigoriphilum]TFD49112.1 hypothetical protein E3T55_11815 [Cryobacterium frigoriphilum]
MTIAPTSLLKRLPVRAMLASGAALGLGTILTFAAFSDDGAVTAEFSTGNVDIAFDGGAQGTPTPYASNLKMSDAKIGDVVYRQLIVNNQGSLDFSYGATQDVALSLTPDSAKLAGALDISVVKVTTVDTCAAADFTTAAPTPIRVSTVKSLTLPVSPILAGTKSKGSYPTKDIFCFRLALIGATSGGSVTANNALDSALMNETVGVKFDFVATQLPA